MMHQVKAVSILALTVILSLSRPSFGRFRIDHAPAAVLGGLLAVLFGVVPLPAALGALRFLVIPIIAIASLMVITLVAEESGLFDLLARSIARAAKGNPRRLFTYIFFTGTVTGTMFTNDAAVLIFTPLVFRLIEDVQENDWTLANKIPFYFAVLYVANVAGAFIISNPINIVACQIHEVGFVHYAQWMVLPALVSIVTSYFGLRWFFRKSLPRSFRPLPRASAEKGNPRAMKCCGAVLLLTLLAFFSEGMTGIPTWVVALSSALLLLIIHQFMNRSGVGTVFRGVRWDVLIFVTGIFVIATGVRASGLTANVGKALSIWGGDGLFGLTHSTAFIAGGLASMMNNHPTVDTMAMIIRDMDLPVLQRHMVLFSSLIGGDLGPKMLPIGSLAALMWFGILRSRGVQVSYWLYIKIGIPVTLIAILLAVLTLNLEWVIHQALYR